MSPQALIIIGLVVAVCAGLLLTEAWALLAAAGRETPGQDEGDY